ncbi:MAG: hydrogenase formation protein HypD [Campylobacter sp.]|nr:hydrogenase formation protein HypD [Campylobacter sp.]
MDLINDFRDKEYVLGLARLINKSVVKPINIMEICGGHTHSIMKFGLPDLLDKKINFIHGPGCPVCVMPMERIDEAIELANTDGVILCTLADMIRIPGSNKQTLAKARASGKDIRALYTPLDALKIATENPQKKVVFFAIGFETTTPMTCVLIQKALELKLTNLFFHINHVTVPNTIKALLDDKDNQIDAFLAPSHVSVITGYEVYKNLAKIYHKPFAVSGFEPVDILDSIRDLITQHQNGSYEVFNEYSRVVSKNGNQKAKELIDKFLTPSSFKWRGLGEIPNSGYELKSEFDFINAKKVFKLNIAPAKENRACICGEILRGRAKPYECKVFGKVCNPQNPVGSCMVSSEGACAAYYRYKKLDELCK